MRGFYFFIFKVPDSVLQNFQLEINNYSHRVNPPLFIMRRSFITSLDWSERKSSIHMAMTL